MGYVEIVARGLQWWMRLRNPTIKVEVLRLEHVEPAAQLLSNEFCRREPLCAVLGIPLPEILPFFRDQVRHVAAQGLGIVALDHDGVLQGVLTNEDYTDPFQPEGATTHEGLLVIGEYLDSNKIPPAILPQRRGELYHCALAAVAPGRRHTQVLPMMIVGSYFHLKKLGYSKGYAKVSNPGIVRRLRMLEGVARRPLFTSAYTAKPAEFIFQGRRPFAGYEGETSVFTWAI